MNTTVNAKVYAFAVLIVLMFSVAQVTSAGPLEDGFAAAKRGDHATALRLLRPLASQGEVQSQTLLGLMYRDGTGVTQDYVEAVKWLRLAANQGEPTAELSLGEMYLYGKGGAIVKSGVWRVDQAATLLAS
jgi:TPR repeat protein